MGLWRALGSFGAACPTDRRRVDDALAAVGLSGFEQALARRAVGRPGAAGAVRSRAVQDAG
jgi:hypothetical protein